MIPGRVMIRSAWAALAVILLFAPVAASARQASSDCEQKVKSLEERVKQLEDRLREMAQQNDALRKRLGDTPGGGGGSSKTPAPAPQNDPLTSPQTMFDALLKSYDDGPGKLPRDTKPEQAKYLAAVKDWARDSGKLARGQVSWVIRVVKIDSGMAGPTRPASVTFEVLDAAGKPAGFAATQPFPARHARLLAEGVGDKRFKLKGNAEARPRFSPQRAEKGTVEEPRFIGPFAEFEFDLAVSDVEPVAP